MSECQSGHFGPCFHPERIDPNFVRLAPGPYIEERRRLRHQRPRYDVSRLGVTGELVEFIYDMQIATNYATHGISLETFRNCF